MLKWISNLRIRWKILIAPAFLALALMSLGLYALHIQRANQAVVDQVTTGVAQQADLACAVESSSWRAKTRVLRVSPTHPHRRAVNKDAPLGKETAAVLQ